MGVVGRLLANCFAHWGLGADGAARLARVVLVVAGLGLAALCLCEGWTMLTGGKTRQVESRLDGAMVGAAARNAVDAVSVVQQRAASEDTMERTVNHAQSAINAASDAAGADAAGRDGLCAVSAGFCAATRVQQPGAR